MTTGYDVEPNVFFRVKLNKKAVHQSPPRNLNSERFSVECFSGLKLNTESK